MAINAKPIAKDTFDKYVGIYIESLAAKGFVAASPDLSTLRTLLKDPQAQNPLSEAHKVLRPLVLEGSRDYWRRWIAAYTNEFNVYQRLLITNPTGEYQLVDYYNLPNATEEILTQAGKNCHDLAMVACGPAAETGLCFTCQRSEEVYMRFYGNVGPLRLKIRFNTFKPKVFQDIAVAVGTNHKTNWVMGLCGACNWQCHDCGKTANPDFSLIEVKLLQHCGLCSACSGDSVLAIKPPQLNRERLRNLRRKGVNG